MRNLERGALQLPEFGDLVEELELDASFGGEFVESLNPRDELEGVDVDGEGWRPVVGRNHLADARLLGDRLDLGDVLERLSELLRRRSEDGTFRRWDEVELVQFGHGQRHPRGRFNEMLGSTGNAIPLWLNLFKTFRVSHSFDVQVCS